MIDFCESCGLPTVIYTICISCGHQHKLTPDDEFDIEQDDCPTMYGYDGDGH